MRRGRDQEVASVSVVIPRDSPSSSSGEVLPFPPVPSASVAGRTMQESVYAQREPARHLPEDAPNIVIVLIDDAGPALPSTFGGDVRTATMDRVCAEEVSLNRFHTTAICSPTRASLLMGRNDHRLASGTIQELANDWDGYSGHIPKSSALVAEVLRCYGYSTGAWGKWHNTPLLGIGAMTVTLEEPQGPPRAARRATSRRVADEFRS
jgi:Sulfatase